ncbi:MAG: polysaccharide biosynthesis tyrosine autokinase [Solirubrobacterales bacterium]
MGLVEAIRRRKEIVAVCALLVPGVVLVVSLTEEPRYEATATVRVDSRDGEELSAADVIGFADTDEVALRTGEELGGASEDFVSSRVSVAEGPAANTYEVTASSDTPGPAADMATTFAERFVEYADELGGRFAGEATVVEEADAPADPVSPRTVRNTLIGAVVGLVGGLLLALLRDVLDRRVTGLRELDALLGAPVLARVPKSPTLELGESLRVLPAADAETFQAARLGIRYRDADRELDSVLVTSPQAGDGKTTIAFCLAAAAATTGDRVLVVEADLRQPSLSAVAEPQPFGLTSVLAGEAGIEEAVVSVEVASGADGVSGSIDLIHAGAASANPTPLLESERMAQLLDGAEREYDLVIVDTPPAAILPDAIPLLGRVDGVVIVVGLGRDRREEVEELHDRLEQYDVPVIGVIANFAEPFDESYYRYIQAHEAAVAEAGTVPFRAPARRAAPRPARRRPETPTPARTEPLSSARAPDGPLDLNEVTYEELRSIDLSITQAKRLIAYRERRGGFSSLDDIDDLPGFPDEVLEELKDRSSVGS